jgi:hypothetical protein
MSDPNLHVLEREVEAARAKLADDLSTLRAPGTYSEFTSGLKHEALEMKDTLVDKAKSSVQSTIDDLVVDLKSRAAANPAAVLAIGAGIAWRLIQRPPIATALIGAGLYSLFRTTPQQPAWRTTENYLSQAKDRLGEQARDLADSMKERAVAIGEAATEKGRELAASVKEQVSSASGTATEKATELTDAAKGKMQDWSDEARTSARRVSTGLAEMTGGTSERLDEVRRSAGNATAQATFRASAMVDEWSRPLEGAVTNAESRDKLLLGAASVAVIAALGLACQRRLSETAEAD